MAVAYWEKVKCFSSCQHCVRPILQPHSCKILAFSLELLLSSCPNQLPALQHQQCHLHKLRFPTLKHRVHRTCNVLLSCTLILSFTSFITEEIQTSASSNTPYSSFSTKISANHTTGLQRTLSGSWGATPPGGQKVQTFRAPAWVAQVLRVRLDFCSGHDLRVKIHPHPHLPSLSRVFLRFSLCLSLCPNPLSKK
ncbi:unnamed protein product [Nyctereutes procyonoides]|uniref:(raccoon dog) hypothetical protein n=1 Tax=Nyctereutes procyonoides TaxID=34880 RepID=A0A812A023_NYCPR|nr:unnamed protein product [Nyctereutes procyonoides]